MAEFYYKRLRLFRYFQGISMSQLAKELGVSKTLISKWENGETTPNAVSIAGICALFGLPEDYFTKESLDFHAYKNEIRMKI